MMRFKKGSKVEVLSTRGVPSGSWRCAEIIGGNGHSYTVRYDGCGDVLERRSRKEIRPCPPPPSFATNWAAGDVVEVFDNFSWKVATISMVLRKKYAVVRLLGSSLEFKVCEVDVRARQSWDGDKWFVIGKDSVSSSKCTHNEDLTLKNNSMVNHFTERKVHALAENGCLPIVCKEKFQESIMAYPRTLKRGYHGQPETEAYNGAIKKRRAIEKGDKLHRVEAATFARDITTSERVMHPSFNNQTWFVELDKERRKRHGANGCSFAIDVKCHDTDSDACSVGSCSVTSNNSYMLHRTVGFVEDINGDSSDAESCFQPEYEERDTLLPTKEELATEIHRLELHAYRCTMEALHACGPLSWDQEAMVTNLRLSLHISNDEHLMEVRNLVSADNRISSR